MAACAPRGGFVEGMGDMAYRDDLSPPSGAGIRDEAPARPEPMAFKPSAERLEALPASQTEIPAIPAQKPRNSRKRVVIGAVLLAALAGGTYEGYGWWTTGRFMVSTDDAYVQADITILGRRTSGYVDTVAAAANQSAKAADL